MTKRREIEIDGKYYRMRRGKLVEIPPEWVGVVTRPQTIRKRQSKMIRKIKMRIDKWYQPRTAINPRNQAPRHSSVARASRKDELEMDQW